MSHSIN